jgi:hypothetical protein
MSGKQTLKHTASAALALTLAIGTTGCAHRKTEVYPPQPPLECLSIMPGTITLPNAVAGKKPEEGKMSSVMLRISNNCGKAVNISDSKIVLSEGVQPDPRQIGRPDSPGAFVAHFPQKLAKGEKANIEVDFLPASEGLHECTMSVSGIMNLTKRVTMEHPNLVLRMVSANTVKLEGLGLRDSHDVNIYRSSKPIGKQGNR